MFSGTTSDLKDHQGCIISTYTALSQRAIKAAEHVIISKLVCAEVAEELWVLHTPEVPD